MRRRQEEVNSLQGGGEEGRPGVGVQGRAQELGPCLPWVPSCCSPPCPHPVTGDSSQGQQELPGPRAPRKVPTPFPVTAPTALVLVWGRVPEDLWESAGAPLTLRGGG